jgi:hypothetical protein
MNGVFLDNERMKKATAINQFVNEVEDFFQSIQTLDRHRKALVAKYLKLFHMEKDRMTAFDFMLKTSILELNQMKIEAFIMLLALVSGRSISETRKFYADIFEKQPEVKQQ